MGIFDRLFGRTPQQGYQQQPYPQQGYGQQGYPQQQTSYPQQSQQRGPARQTPGASMSEDERAIARYEYMLKTAPPEEIEKAHAEAFAKLTPDQRQQVLTRLATADPQGAPTSTDPQVLARAATRAEMRQPGFLQQSFGGYGMGGGMGRMGGLGMGGGMGMGSMLLTSVAGAFVGTAIADAMFDGWGDDFDRGDMEEAYRDGYQDGERDGDHDGGDQDFADGGGDNGDYADGQDFAGGDDFGGFDGGGFDGGDFGGGDFGGDMGGFDF